MPLNHPTVAGDQVYVRIEPRHRRVLAVVVVCSTACSSSGSPTAPSPGDTTLVGVVGCSQTSAAWGGWLDRGDGRVWNLLQGYGGGDIAEWSRTIPSGDYWSRLERNIAGNQPANAVWWQVCDLAMDNGTLADSEAVLVEIRRRLPGATVYVSPLADFERPETCQKQDLENSRRLVDHVVSAGGAFRGPNLPLVLDEWVQSPTGNGKCNSGAPGREAFGSVLAAFNWGSSP